VACINLATKTAHGYRGTEQEVHISGKIQGLQEHAETGYQNADEHGAENQHRDGLQQRRRVDAHVLGQIG
jgi:hypothetical protein